MTDPIVQEKLWPDRERTPIPNTTWGKPQYNKIKGDKQRIELSRGCPHNCEYCYAPDNNQLKIFPVPEIRRVEVEILDMEILWPRNKMMKKLRNLPESLEGKRIKYEAICGFDWRLIDKDVAKLLKNKNFKNPRIAWDGSVRNQYKIKDTIDILTNTGYRAQDIAVFMLVNHEISFKECVEKMDLLKIWGVRIADCCFDGGYRNAVPEYWSAKEIKEFRRRSRKHNQLVRFGIDPEIDPLNDDQRSLGDNYE